VGVNEWDLEGKRNEGMKEEKRREGGSSKRRREDERARTWRRRSALSRVAGAERG
jgi:hypothetical protein